MQVNDTSYHRQSKALYCKHEMKLMLEKLQRDPQKIPQPAQDEMMNMFQKCQDNHLSSKKFKGLVGTGILEFQKSSWKVNQEGVYVTNGNPDFCLFLYLTGIHFRGELKHVGDASQLKIKCFLRTREKGGVSLSDILSGRIHLQNQRVFE